MINGETKQRGDITKHGIGVEVLLSIRKMQKSDVGLLFNIALLAFKPDSEKYGMYPPLMRLNKKEFLPSQKFGKIILYDGEIIGGVFVMAFGKKGILGSIFLDPQQQGKGYGRQAMLMIEKMYPKVRRWKLDTPSESHGLHKFYKSLGYIKTGEMEDSGMKGFIFEKTIE